MSPPPSGSTSRPRTSSSSSAVLAWVAIIGAKLQRLQRQLAELVDRLREREERDG